MGRAREAVGIKGLAGEADLLITAGNWLGVDGFSTNPLGGVAEREGVERRSFPGDLGRLSGCGDFASVLERGKAGLEELLVNPGMIGLDPGVLRVRSRLPDFWGDSGRCSTCCEYFLAAAEGVLIVLSRDPDFCGEMDRGGSRSSTRFASEGVEERFANWRG
jgi:hypothetical protein